MKLLDCYLPVFKLAARFAHEPEIFADYDTFRALCISRLEESMQEACHHDISESERDHAFFAVVVWLDETLLCSAQPLVQHWRSGLLQRKYFRTSIGGELFFSRLSDLKEEEQGARQVFLFCLHNGFCGKYGGEQDRQTLTALIEQQLRLCLPPAWQTWPNDAPLTPVNVGERSMTSSGYNVVFAIPGLVLFYAALVLLLTLYFS